MEKMAHQTKLFKDIFPTYEEFASWYANLPLSSGDIPSEKTFALIFYEYADSHSTYDDVMFKNKFAIDIYSYYKEFEATTKAIDDLMSLSDDDVSISGYIVSNFAEIPETEQSTDAESVDYISNQTKNISKKGKMQIAREQLSNKRAYTVKTFLKRFKHLFITVFSPAYIPMIEDNF